MKIGDKVRVSSNGGTGEGFDAVVVELLPKRVKLEAKLGEKTKYIIKKRHLVEVVSDS